MNNKKTFKSIDEQLIILKDRGLVINDEEQVKNILLSENYYKIINGYKDLFVEYEEYVDENGELKYVEKFKEGTTFEELYRMYVFDSEIKRIILNKILKIESNLRSLISYNFSMKYGEDNYLKFSNFDSLKGVNAPIDTLQQRATHIHELIANIQKTVATSISKKDYIKHYITKYGYIPLWVLVNIISLGTLSKFYDLMYQPERVNVSKYYNIKENELSQYIKNIAFYRNLCAHDDRVYNAKLGKTNSIPDTIYHKTLGIPMVNDRYAYGKNDLFSLIITLKILLPQNEFYNLFNVINHQVYRLENCLTSINITDVYDVMGFPNTWREIKKS